MSEQKRNGFVPQMMIANALRDGRVVFLADDDRWLNDIAAGRIAHSESEARELAEIATRAEADNLVVGPELIEVEEHGSALRPVEIREAIRAAGPVVRGHPGEND